MKTKIFISIALLILLIFTWSCNDYLDEVNMTRKTQEMVFNNEDAMIGLVASCYSYLKLWYGKEAAFGLTEGGTDLWYNAKDNAQVELVTYNGITPELTSSCLDQYWDGFYAAIGQCNLAQKLITDFNLPAEKKNPYIAEARFLRAFYYWHVVETWGPCEIITNVRDSISSVAFRNPVDSVYAQMFRDVKFAIDNLDSTKTAPNSRVTHWTAKAFMARLLLYYASEYNHPEKYSDASRYAINVINGLKGFGKDFYPKYEDVWKIENNNTSNNKEFIWACDYYDKIDVTIPYNYLPAKPGGGNWNGLIARRQITESGGSGGNIMHLMVTPLWQSQNDNVGGAPINNEILVRNAGLETTPKYYTTGSPGTKTLVDLGYWYVKYGLGYTRYAPTRHLMDLYDENRDQRWNATFRTAWYKFPGIVPKNWGVKASTLANPAADSCRYPKMSTGTNTDTCLFYYKHVLSPEQKAWAVGRYKILDVTNTFLGDGVTPNAITGNTGANQMYPMMRKFENTDSKIALPQTTFQDYFSYRDFPIFRISEMYLIAAEALMNSNTGDALNYINALRSARAISGKASEFQLNSIDINTILDERAIEFAGENIRWFDLKRTHKLGEFLVHNKKVLAGKFQEFHYLRPIPASMINAVTNRTSGPDPNGFWQNPGY